MNDFELTSANGSNATRYEDTGEYWENESTLAFSLDQEGTAPAPLGASFETGNLIGLPINASAGLIGGSSSAPEQIQWYETENGTFYAQSSDGIVFEMYEDTTVVAWSPDGSVHQQNPNGTVDHWSPSGEFLGSDFEYFYSDPNGDATAVPYEDPNAQPALEGEWDGVYGNSYAWNGDWFWQGETNYCAPTSVAILVNEYFNTGINNPEYMAQMALDLGLNDDFSNGMPSNQIAPLLEANGVPAEHVNSDMDDLARRLESGYGVIAVVDSGEIWGEAEDIQREDWVSDHALVVTEINTSEQTVTLADPGTPDGNGLVVSVAQFEDAWADSNYEMVSTVQADPDIVDEQVRLDGGTGKGGQTETAQLAWINLTGRQNIY